MKNSRSITGRDPSTGQVLEIGIADGRIQAITPSRADAVAWVSPGFIDLQVNGYLGSDVNTDTVNPDVVISLTRNMLTIGATTFLPTIVTASEQKITAALRTVAAAPDQSNGGAGRPVRSCRGADISLPKMAREAFTRASMFVRQAWRSLSDGRSLPAIWWAWSQSPRIAATHWSTLLYSERLLMAIGHSDATPTQIHAAADAGATLSTHLGNGLGSSLPRHPNLLWTQVAEDRLTATFIADGHHLPDDTLKTMLRAKGLRRSVLVSDAVALGGMPAGRYHTAVGGAVELTSDGRVTSATGTRFLAGAYRPLIDGIAHTAGIEGISLGSAVQMTMENPGRFVGRRGMLCVGAYANLVRFHWDAAQGKLKIQNVLVQGGET